MHLDNQLYGHQTSRGHIEPLTECSVILGSGTMPYAENVQESPPASAARYGIVAASFEAEAATGSLAA